MIQTGERFGTTWWGRLWLNALEQLGDGYEFRLQRGKKYAQEGVVSHFSVNPGLLQAKVHGKKTYEVTLALPALTQAQWERALERITLESRFVASLLAGEMPKGLDEIFRESGASLYPRVPKELQTHCTCPDSVNPCKHVAAVCYVMAEILDRDPWILFDLRGRTQEDILASLHSLSTVANADPPPRKRGRPKKNVSISDLVVRKKDVLTQWSEVSPEKYDSLPFALPTIVIPRSISPDPSVFVQLGPLPHARIEASLCLAALMHRTAQVVQKQIEEGVGAIDMEDENTESEVVSPFETPLPTRINHRPHRHWRQKRRRWSTS
ncbi:MAG: SWIM zinc finger family protein [Holophagaceae bacterium]|nr:SWIM zinc finger family protein [Holophagaceae bacterium]